MAARGCYAPASGRSGAAPAFASEAEDPLAEALDTLPEDTRLLLVVDQLEELFTACATDDERAAFADLARRAAAIPAGRAVVVVAVRADFYGRFAAYPAFAELLGGNHVWSGRCRLRSCAAPSSCPPAGSGCGSSRS